jgi:hypothetical protein
MDGDEHLAFKQLVRGAPGPGTRVSLAFATDRIITA